MSNNQRNLLIALPAAFTLTSVLFGVLAILNAETAPYQAALAIVFAALCDLLDGRVARLTRTESDFGVQLDSLADAVSFGVAPAMLVYHFALTGLTAGPIDIGLTIAFVYIGCGLIRLARFNVMASDPNFDNDFKGIPIPIAALLLAGIVMAAHSESGGPLTRAALVGPITVLSAILMVSGIRFRSFKKKAASIRRTIAAGAAVIIGLGILITKTSVGLMLVVVSGTYILAGLAGAMLRFSARLRQ
jgi:CDP-diacylglycerol--serine O-phosphatidyltransferase